MHAERTNALLGILHNVKARNKAEGHNHFSMLRWADSVTMAKGGAYCWTVACACGWMALSDRGKADGLELIGGDLYYHGWENYDAAAAYFEITTDQARFLFSAMNYEGDPPIDEVIARIEEVWLSSHTLRLSDYLYLERATDG